MLIVHLLIAELNKPQLKVHIPPARYSATDNQTDRQACRQTDRQTQQMLSLNSSSILDDHNDASLTCWPNRVSPGCMPVCMKVVYMIVVR